jgi:hypothetical protein
LTYGAAYPNSVRGGQPRRLCDPASSGWIDLSLSVDRLARVKGLLEVTDRLVVEVEIDGAGAQSQVGVDQR